MNHADGLNFFVIMAVGLVLIWLATRKKKPRFMIVESFEIRRERKQGAGLLGWVIAAGVVWLLWAVGHHGG